MREEMQYYFRTCLRIIAEEGRENNPTLISNTNKPALLTQPLPQEGDLASRSWAFLDRASHSLDGTTDGSQRRRPETQRGRLRGPFWTLDTAPAPTPDRRQDSSVFLWETELHWERREGGVVAHGLACKARGQRGPCTPSGSVFSGDNVAGVARLQGGSELLTSSPTWDEPFPRVGGRPAQASLAGVPADTSPDLLSLLSTSTRECRIRAGSRLASGTREHTQGL